MRDYGRLLLEHPRFLTFGILLTFCSNFGQTFFINLFQDEFLAMTGLREGAYGRLYSGATLLSGLTLLWVGPRIDNTHLLRYSMFVCSGLALACLFISLTSTPLMLFFAIFTLRLTGQGLMGHTASTSVSRYLKGARGKALGVIGLGYPIGEAVFPILAVLLIAFVGWRGTWQVFALALALVLVPLVRFLLHGHDARHAAHLEEAQASTTDQNTTQQRQWSVREVLRDVRFYLVLPAVLGPPFISTGIFFNGIPISMEREWSKEQWAACIAVYAAATVVSSLIGGNLADRWSPRRMIAFYLIPHATGLIFLASGDPLWFGLAYMIGAGITAGANSSVVGALWPELYGVLHLGAIRTLLSSAMVFSTAASPVLMGELTEHGVSIDIIAWWFFGYTVVASACSWLAMRR